MKPKLGNAALIFADETPRDKPSFSVWLAQDKWAKYVIAFTMLFAIIGTVVVAQTPEYQSLNQEASQPKVAPDNVEVVSAASRNDQLVGTLIRDQESSQDGYARTKAQTLTPQERERLLQIIRN